MVVELYEEEVYGEEFVGVEGRCREEKRLMRKVKLRKAFYEP